MKQIEVVRQINIYVIIVKIIIVREIRNVCMKVLCYHLTKFWDTVFLHAFCHHSEHSSAEI